MPERKIVLKRRISRRELPYFERAIESATRGEDPFVELVSIKDVKGDSSVELHMRFYGADDVLLLGMEVGRLKALNIT